MANHRLVLRLLVPFLLAVLCAAQQPPGGKVIDLTAADGVKLKSTYFAAAKPGPGVLLLHQCNQTRKAWDTLAERLAAAGFNVLTMDYRGFGESGGTPFNQLAPQEQARMTGTQWPMDTDVAFQYLAAQPGVKREIAGVGGASCGANQAVHVAIRHPEVKSLVLLSGGADPDGRRFLQKSALPMFMSSADDDADGNTSIVMQWLYGLTPNPGNKFVRYPTGGHGNEMFAVRKELPGMIVDWFDTTLVKTPGKATAVRPAAVQPNVLAMVEERDGPARVAQMLAEARKTNPKAVLYPEFVVNVLGYERLQAGNVQGALEMFKLNVTAFPDSPNVYDSLSDAYLAGGQTALALQNARKALELLASNTTASEQQRKGIKDSAEQKLKQFGENKP
jgi:dienelactone hydrolase